MSDNLVLGYKYTRKDLSELFNQVGIKTSREGIVYIKSSIIFNQYLFFVDLEKEGKEERFHFNDYFNNNIFHWDSQTTQHENSPRIQKILKKEVDILLFTRVHPKIKGKTQPFVYCGKLEYHDHDENTSKPIHITFKSLDYIEDLDIKLFPELYEIYNWEGKPKSGDPKKPISYKKPSLTEREGLVTSRVGQGWYRREILKKWGNRCPITGSSITNILISSHIKRWSESNNDERLDPDNGILLSPNVDSLFDKYLISFEDDGSMIVSKKLSMNELKFLGIDSNIKIEINDGMKKYLLHHRSIFNNKS